AEEITQQHRHEDVGRHDPDEDGRHPFDRVDEAVHVVAGHDGAFGVYPPVFGEGEAQLCRVGKAKRAHRLSRWARRYAPLPTLRSPRGFAPPQYPALYFASWSLSSFIATTGSTPTLRTLSAQVFSSGSAAFFHCAS